MTMPRLRLIAFAIIFLATATDFHVFALGGALSWPVRHQHDTRRQSSESSQQESKARPPEPASQQPDKPQQPEKQQPAKQQEPKPQQDKKPSSPQEVVRGEPRVDKDERLVITAVG